MREWGHIPLLVVAVLTAACAYAMPPGALQLRLMTFNIHHGVGNDACQAQTAGRAPAPGCALDLDRIARIIRDADVDVAALQEVDRFWARSGTVDQAAELARLVGMQPCYGANLRHEADAHADGAHEYGTLVLSRYPVADCTNTLLPRADSSSEQRGLLMASIRLPNRVLRVYNTHLHIREEDRRLQAAAIIEHLAADRLSVLAGDLNAAPDAPYLSPLFARLEDVWRARGRGDGFTSPARPDIAPRRRIDYILVSPEIAIRRAATLRGSLFAVASDHYPVVADLLVPGARRLPGRQLHE